MKKIITLIVTLFMLANAIPAQAKAMPVQIVSVTAAQDPIIIRGYLSCSDYSAHAVSSVVENRLNISVTAIDTQPLRGCVSMKKPFSVSVIPTAGVAYQVYVNSVYYLTYRR